jgi:membrane protease YdiL (CAAX protease family)
VLPLGIGYSIALRVAVAICMAMLAGFLIVTRIVTPAGLPEFIKANQPNLEAVVDVKLMRDNPLYFWLVITLVSFVVAGLREELWRAGFLAGLRKLWPNWFGSRVGQMGGVVIASIIFGLGHVLMGWLAVLAATLLGLLLGLIMVLHRSIWPAVFAHGLFDATSFALLPLVAELQKTSGQ